jgi:hypothetical protein
MKYNPAKRKYTQEPYQKSHLSKERLPKLSPRDSLQIGYGNML